MAGLNCGRPSPLALPLVQRSYGALVAVGDEAAEEAMRLLASEGIRAGESGAAGLAGLLAIADDPGARAAAGIDETARVLTVITEGVTDPVNYARVVGA
jgi:diaminopropionate ammonia-lyase